MPQESFARVARTSDEPGFLTLILCVFFLMCLRCRLPPRRKSASVSGEFIRQCAWLSRWTLRINGSGGVPPPKRQRRSPRCDTQCRHGAETAPLLSPVSLFGEDCIICPSITLAYKDITLVYQEIALAYPETTLAYPEITLAYLETALGYLETALGYLETALVYPGTALGYIEITLANPETSLERLKKPVHYPVKFLCKNILDDYV